MTLTEQREKLVQMVSGCLHDGLTAGHEECNAEAERIVSEYEAAWRAESAKFRRRNEQLRAASEHVLVQMPTRPEPDSETGEYPMRMLTATAPVWEAIAELRRALGPASPQP